jgi:Ion channel
MLALQIAASCCAILMIVSALWDAFETMVLPRRIAHRFRLTRLYTAATWRLWTAISRGMRPGGRRESFLAVIGPLALLGLLVVWVTLLIFGFGLLQWGLGSHLGNQSGRVGFGTDVYFSGTTLLTLGLGDVVPHGGLARAVTVIEVGTGFGVLALVIGYLPVLYQAFSRRETRISLLDAHAGSPPTAGALILRHPPAHRAARLTGILNEWEGWSAELLETHLSYPLLAFYRSQHEEQSWVAALTMILDTCALVVACAREQALDEQLAEQAAFTFAMARHAAADLAQSFGITSREQHPSERLSTIERARITEVLVHVGLVQDAAMAAAVLVELDELRRLYETHMAGLATLFLMPLPPWMHQPGALDDWQTTADDLTAPPIKALAFRDGNPLVARPQRAGSQATQEATDARLDR